MHFRVKLDELAKIPYRMLDCFRRQYYLEACSGDGSDESGKAE